MSLTVTQRPSQTIGSETSTWNAVGNPILYKMQRKDFTFNQVNDNAGDIQLQFNAVDVASSFQVGDTVYIQSDNSVYDLFAVVTASAFSVNTLVTVDAAYVSAAPGGFTNNDDLRPAYRVEVELYRSSDDELISDAVLENSPNRYGEVNINVSKILRAYLSANNDADLTGSTEVFDDTNVYIGFYIKYTEVWLESAESQTDDVANQFFAVLGARQIPSTYGGNMGTYAVRSGGGNILNDVDFTTNWSNEGSGEPWTLGFQMVVQIDQDVSQRARRSLAFTEEGEYRINIVGSLDNGDPVNGFDLKVYLGGVQEIDFGYVSGNTFDVTESVVSNSDYTFFEIEASTVGHDVNEITIDEVIIDELGIVRFLTKLERPVMWRGYPFLISAIINEGISNNVYLDATDTTTPADYAGKIVEFDLNQIITDQTVNSIDIAIFEDDTPDVQLSETLTIELRDPCANPILLVGRNSLGGVLEWMFDVNQEYTFDYGDQRKAKRLVLTAVNLTINQWEALQDFITLGEVYRNNIVEFTSSTIKTSTRIGQQLYVVDSDGSKIGVIAIPTKNKTRTKQIKHIFEIEIEYPEIFTS